jgi:phospho-N-acetylmuramoyl-pentapeptide-transferase
MLYLFLYPFHTTYSGLNVFKYITFRTALAALTALTVSFVLGPIIIRRLAALQVGQMIRSDGPAAHQTKAGTPTMGGTLILFSLVVATVLLADVRNLYVCLAMAVTVAFGAIGFADDYRKVTLRNAIGLRKREKLFYQCGVAVAAAAALYAISGANGTVAMPFLKNVRPDLGWLYVPFAAFVVTVAGATYAIFAYVSGHAKIAQYLQIPYVAGAGELAIFCAALAAAGLGFLWFNAYPASMFMGDVGSLALGAALATVALATRHEIVLAIVGGIFVVEALSVIFQVGSYKLRRRRIFRMAPIHHHFELKGWPEPLIIVRFWILAIICALVALATLKLR